MAAQSSIISDPESPILGLAAPYFLSTKWITSTDVRFGERYGLLVDTQVITYVNTSLDLALYGKKAIIPGLKAQKIRSNPKQQERLFLPEVCKIGVALPFRNGDSSIGRDEALAAAANYSFYDLSKELLTPASSSSAMPASFAEHLNEFELYH
ncbi:hypothetical protein Pfo_018272 [Paulownia fortunei]|nr:hypothetical protein Pfo_018272 [Paulownia fortunei]